MEEAEKVLYLAPSKVAYFLSQISPDRKLPPLHFGLLHLALLKSQLTHSWVWPLTQALQKGAKTLDMGLASLDDGTESTGV